MASQVCEIALGGDVDIGRGGIWCHGRDWSVWRLTVAVRGRLRRGVDFATLGTNLCNLSMILSRRRSASNICGSQT